MSAVAAMQTFVMGSSWMTARHAPVRRSFAVRGGPAVRSRTSLALERRISQRPPPAADLDEVRANVALAAAGSAEAFGALYDRYHPDILRYFDARVRNSDVAQDLTQQLFLRAWQAVPRYQDRGLPFAAWLFRMARNIAVDHYRAHRRLAPIDDVDLPSDQAGAADGLIADERSARVRRALDRLSEDHRQVLILRFVLEKSAREIGQIMGRKEVTVRGLQHRALRALRAELQVGGELP